MIMQMNQTECGLCCCAMILRFYKSNESLFELREMVEVGRDGLNFNQLKEIFEGKGFDTRVFKGSLEGIRSVPLPVIAFWNQGHFVVIEKVSDLYVHVVDPELGRRKLSMHEFKDSFSNYILVPTPTERFKAKKEKPKNVWVDIIANLKDRKPLFGILLTLSLVSYLLALGAPILVQKVIDYTVIEQGNIDLSVFVIGVVFVTVLYCLTLLARGLKLITMNVFLSRRLMMGTFGHLLKLPYKFFDLRSPGDLLFRLSSVNGVRELISTQVVSGVIDAGALLIITFYLFSKSVFLSVITVALFACITLFMFLIRPSISEAINNEISEQSKSQSMQVEALFSIASVKMSGMEDEIFALWKQQYKQVLRQFKKRYVLQNIYDTVLGTVQTASPLIILLVGVYLFSQDVLSLGEVVAYHALSTSYFGLGRSLFGSYTQYVLATSYLERIADITYSPQEQSPTNPIDHKITGELELRNVSFSYTKHSNDVIKNVSVKIRSGEKIALVGPSGSGKTTLGKILVGLYSPNGGTVMYDGIPSERFMKKDLCSQMGIVPQDIQLFNKTILDNIRMNKREVSMEKIREVARAAQIEEDIQSLPMGYQTIVSEMGMNFSGGQRQRIAFARALLGDPKILILDEATSSLDNVNEAQISEYLSSIGCTRIVIAHRLSTIKDSDCIYVMNNGEIVEQGTHNELLSREGFYKELYDLSGDKSIESISI
ncbi:peptidase domain-containing ABC transporter [Baia soyae]